MKRPLRIGIDAHYIDGFPQGVKTIIDSQVQELAAMQQQHQYFLYHRNARAGGEPAARIHGVPLVTNAGQFNYIAGFPWRGLADKLDVFQSHYILPLWMPCATVVGIYDILFEMYPEFFGVLHTMQMKALVKRSAKLADRIITISEFTKTEIIERYGVDAGKVHVLRCGVSPRFTVQHPEITAATLARLGIRQPYILCVGRRAPIKNMAGMLRAFGALARANRDYRLVIVGADDPTFVDRTLRGGSRGGAGDFGRIDFAGAVAADDLVSLYNGAELFVFPSFGEGFGLPVLEAMACGTPVLCSNKTALPEVCGDVAVQFNPDRQDEFDRQLITLAGEPDIRQAMGKKGPGHAAQFTWRNYAQQANAVYLAAANGRTVT